MEQPRSYTLPGGLAVTRTQPAIGALVSGIDLSQPLPGPLPELVVDSRTAGTTTQGDWASAAPDM